MTNKTLRRGSTQILAMFGFAVMASCFNTDQSLSDTRVAQLQTPFSYGITDSTSLTGRKAWITGRKAWVT